MEINQIFTITTNPGIDREWIVPSLEYDQILRASKVHIDFGGKGFNVSRMLNALGLSSTALGFVGGRTGDYLQEGLHSLGILTDFIWIDEESRTNISVRSSITGQYLKVNEPGPEITPDQQIQLIEKVKILSSNNDLWILSGSLPPGISVDYYAKLIEIIQSNDAKVILDTSGEALNWGCNAAPYLIKPNQQELHELTKMPVTKISEIIAASQSLIEKGINNVLVSMGKDGAILVSRDSTWLVKSPKIKEQNPTGAGDALVGGLVWGLFKDFPIQESLRWGVACGAAAASLSGTAYGSLDQIQSLYEEAKYQKVIE